MGHRNPETCAVRATALQTDLGRRLAAEKIEAARAASANKRSALLREFTVLASWRGRFEEAVRRFLACAATGGAAQPAAALWLADLSEPASAGWTPSPANEWGDGGTAAHAAVVAAEKAAVAAVGGTRRLPRTPAELERLLEASWSVALAGHDRGPVGPAKGFGSWDGSYKADDPTCADWRTPALGGEGPAFLWNAGGRSTPTLRPLADGKWETAVAVARWYIECTESDLQALGFSDCAPDSPKTWSWRCEPLRS